MIDYIKIRLTHDGERKSYGRCKPKKTNRRFNKLYSIPSPSVNGKPLLMDVDFYSFDNRTVIDIKGSWRKWFLGIGTTRDLTYIETKRCIKTLASTIGIHVNKILNAKIKNIELGFTLRFKENMGGVVDAFVYYKGFDTVYEYSRQSVKFKGDAYSVTFYDKFSELMSNAAKRQKEIDDEYYRKTGKRADKKKSKNILADKMNKNNFALRFEVGIKKPSGCPPEFVINSKGKENLLVKTPLTVLKNWNEIVNGLDVIFCRTTFTEYNLNVGLDFLKDKGLKDLSKYETHITASVVGGVSSYVQLLLKKLKGNHRDKNIKKKIGLLNNPPLELREALKSCRNKKNVLMLVKNQRIKALRISDNLN